MPSDYAEGQKFVNKGGFIQGLEQLWLQSTPPAQAERRSFLAAITACLCPPRLSKGRHVAAATAADRYAGEGGAAVVC